MEKKGRYTLIIENLSKGTDANEIEELFRNQGELLEFSLKDGKGKVV